MSASCLHRTNGSCPRRTRPHCRCATTTRGDIPVRLRKVSAVLPGCGCAVPRTQARQRALAGGHHAVWCGALVRVSSSTLSCFLGHLPNVRELQYKYKYCLCKLEICYFILFMVYLYLYCCTSCTFGRRPRSTRRSTLLSPSSVRFASNCCCALEPSCDILGSVLPRGQLLLRFPLHGRPALLPRGRALGKTACPPLPAHASAQAACLRRSFFSLSGWCVI